MNTRYRFRKGKRFAAKILMIPALLLMAFAAVWLGTAAGGYLFDYKANTRGSFVENVDAEYFKNAMSKSLPLIDTIYNSGNVSVTILGELENFLKSITGFDLHNPLTIFNAQSPYFSIYYNKNYLPMLAYRDKPSEPSIEDKPETVTDKPGTTTDNMPQTPEPQPEPDTARQETGYLQDASSIYFEEGDEKKQIPQENNVSSGKVSVLNETKFKIDKAEIDRLLKEPLSIKFDRKGPKFLVYHTHTTESYLSNLSQLKQKDVPAWTSDARYNVVRVGNELTQNLKKYGLEVIHNGTIHDYPNYNLSYVNSLDTLNKYLNSYPSIKVTFDIHRDGLGSSSQKLRAVKSVNGKNAAQVMFVVGSSQKLSHPRWKENLKLAVKLQDKLNGICPELAKPIYVSSNRYNQHLRDGSLIIEIGGDGNTLEEALETTKYLARAINEVIK